MNNLICICGPTASGKTGLAVALAKELDAEVVSCDSMQIYRGMDVGTAKPDAAEMEGVPHHLLDVAEPGEDFSVGRYVQLADAAIAGIHSRGKIAIVCGGTGLYMDSLIKGERFAAPSRPAQREYVEHIAEEKGLSFLYEMLKDADPETAEKLHVSDRKRIVRAMEVFLITGMPPVLPQRAVQKAAPQVSARLDRSELPEPEQALRPGGRPGGPDAGAGPGGGGPAAAGGRDRPQNHRHAGHRLQGNGRRNPGRMQREAGRRADQAGLPQLREAPAHLVPPERGDPLAVR